MAHNRQLVLLGYEDELITEQHEPLVNYTTNKCGGSPNWPSDVNIKTPQCPLCQLPCLLIVQVYAPLEHSIYHRTFYVFACINSSCWNRNESWIVLRVQATEESKGTLDTATTNTKSISATDWCQSANDWGDDDEDNNANFCEENGNLVNNSDDDESASLDESLRFTNLSIDERNANSDCMAEAQGGAVACLQPPKATAEIEGNEGEVISIDTPTFPQNDLKSLLEESLPLPQEFYHRDKQLQVKFVPFFMSVCEETKNASNASDKHVKELLQEYQYNNAEDVSLMQVEADCSSDTAAEKYEKSTPAHGDKMFYNFLSKINQNPGQLIRYSRESESPLLLSPLLQEHEKQCRYCCSELVFEFQILPTLIPKLHLPRERQATRLEFGNVLIYTCRNSCWSSEMAARQECVVVQAEKY